MILRLKEIRSVLEAAQTQSVSMRRRLMLYLFRERRKNCVKENKRHPFSQESEQGKT